MFFGEKGHGKSNKKLLFKKNLFIKPFHPKEYAGDSRS